MKIPLLYFAFSVPYALCIFGGQDVPMDDKRNRFVVALFDGQLFCGGALITLNFVLTAASCVKDKDISRIHGRIGAANLSYSNEGITVRFDKVFLKDPTGQKLVRNNIALLHLEREIDAWKEHKVEVIRYSSNQAENGEECSAFGWGRTKRLTNMPSHVLQEARTRIQDFTSCKFHNDDVDESNICTYVSTASLCDFDAGGPLAYASAVLWGIATEDYACSEVPLLGDVFTRVDSHKDWIDKIIKENSSSGHRPRAVIAATATIVILMSWMHL